MAYASWLNIWARASRAMVKRPSWTWPAWILPALTTLRSQRAAKRYRPRKRVPPAACWCLWISRIQRGPLYACPIQGPPSLRLVTALSSPRSCHSWRPSIRSYRDNRDGRRRSVHRPLHDHRSRSPHWRQEQVRRRMRGWCRHCCRKPLHRAPKRHHIRWRANRSRAVIHSGAVIGADGFGFVLEGDHYEKFPQIGRVVIGNDVEIGANSCIDRAALGVTSIGDGIKLDNMVHIAHNCRIGRHVVIAAQTGLSGGVVVEDYAVIGGQVGIGDKARIESRAVLGSGCGMLTSKIIRWRTGSVGHTGSAAERASRVAGEPWPAAPTARRGGGIKSQVGRARRP